MAVKKIRSGQTHRAIKQELPGSGDEQIRAAHDFADSHGRVVHDGGELIGRNVVMPPDNEIPKVLSSDECLPSQISILEGDAFSIRNPETPTAMSGGSGIGN